MSSKRSHGQGRQSGIENVGRRRFLVNGIVITGSLLVATVLLLPRNTWHLDLLTPLIMNR
jgi:hypothetical protein